MSKLELKDDPFIDDEVFIGKLSLEEVKKHISFSPLTSSRIEAIGERNIQDDDNVCNNSINIIETHSTPNLNNQEFEKFGVIKSESSLSLKHFSKPNDNALDKVKKLVNDMCISPKTQSDMHLLDNTLDVVEFILNNEPAAIESKISETENHNTLFNPGEPFHTTVSNLEHEQFYSCMTPNYFVAKESVFKTPKCIEKTPTPKTPKSQSKFKNIVSPVACYINHCPVPLLEKKVLPRTPLKSGVSFIPKLNSVSKYDHNKENAILPKVAYCAAKETKTITIPDKHKLPKSKWCNQVGSAIPKPIVTKHSYRETNPGNKQSVLQKEDTSFSNLTLCQADLSVHVKKTALRILPQPSKGKFKHADMHL